MLICFVFALVMRKVAFVIYGGWTYFAISSCLYQRLMMSHKKTIFTCRFETEAFYTMYGILQTRDGLMDQSP